MQGQDLYVMAPTFLTFLTAALKNTNVDFTRVIARLTLSVRAVLNVASRIVNWHPIPHVMLDIARNSIVATMVCQSEKKMLSCQLFYSFFCLEQKSLSCHVANLDDSTVEECEQADSPCMFKQIGM